MKIMWYTVAFVFFLPWYTCTLLMPFRWIVLLAHVLHITEFLEQLKLIQDMLYSARFSRALTLLVVENWFFQDSCTSTSNLNSVHHANLMVLQHLCVRINWFFGDIENICGNPNKTHCDVYFKIFPRILSAKLVSVEKSIDDEIKFCAFWFLFEKRNFLI